MSARALFDELRAALRQRVPGTLGALPPGVLPASVLVPFFEQQGEAQLLFLKRPDGSYRHAGQIAFPGGRREADETALECALREAQEEVGLSPADVEILGPLDEYDTVVSGFHVTPFVGIIPFPYPLRPDPREVERLISTPLRVLLDPGIFRTEPREALGRRRMVHFYDAGPDLIWGVTAGMLTPLLELIRTLPSCPRA